MYLVPGTCQLVEKESEIKVTDPVTNSTVCVSDGPVLFSVCKGSCTSYDKSEVRMKGTNQIVSEQYDKLNYLYSQVKLLG